MNKTLYALLAGLVVIAGCSTVTPEQLVERAVPDKSVPIYFTAFVPRGPDSVGGVGVYQEFINPGKKVFKYVLTDYTAQDQVLESVRSDIGGRIDAGTKAIGPYPFGTSSGYKRFDALWYNGSIKCVTLKKVTIVYMDDTSTIIQGEDVAKIVPRGQARSCRQ